MKDYNNISIDELQLDKENHVYQLPSDTGVEFESVTTFIARFFDKFDALGIATKLRKNKTLNIWI